jgi:hypothetical protein
MSIEIADGRYTAKVICWGFTKTDKGSEQFAIEFAVNTHGEEYAPTTLTHFVGLSSDKGVEILDKQLAACGWKGGDYGSIELDTNTPVSLKIENDDYGPKVKFVDPVNGTGGLIERKRMNERDQAALIAKLNARAKTRPAPQGGAPTARTAAPAAPAAPSAPKPPPPRAPAPRPAAPKAAEPSSDWGFDGGGGPGVGDDNVPF